MNEYVINFAAHGKSAFLPLTVVASKDEAAEQFKKIHDSKHIMHDIEEVMEKPKARLTRDEEDYYFFILHDYNKDNLLDGVELLKGYMHEHASSGKRLTDEILERSVDYVLTSADLDGDRYLTFPEFKQFVNANAN
ncbi:hypothetical protein GJ496_000213 [Pomphorhynchus laevis]|nr:hypothetical protein GJ496_000213 [Pomphorhynchus laevis]